jgi:outer membrane lipoprotein-sorting protein
MKRLLLFSCLLTSALANAQEIRNGEGVLRAMHDRYKASWYDTVTFTQKSTTYNPDGTTKVETWHEAALLPGRLRIDIGSPRSGNGLILANGTVTTLKDGKVSDTRPLVNMLLVLGFDVYRQAPETTIDVVKAQGYDLTKLREDVWEGQPVYVVGADKGDLQSRQFWVEKETLLFVREMEPSPGDPKNSETKKAEPRKVRDIRFTNYRKLAGGWIAARVEVHVQDKMIFSEDYSHIRVNAKVGPEVFDPGQFNSTYWEKQ